MGAGNREALLTKITWASTQRLGAVLGRGLMPTRMAAGWPKALGQRRILIWCSESGDISRAAVMAWVKACVSLALCCHT